MTVWWLAASARENDCSYSELKHRNVLAQGWPDTDDLTTLIESHTDKSSLEKALHKEIEKYYPNKNKASDVHREKSLVNLLRIKPEDIIVICEGIEIKGLAKVKEPLVYSYDGNYEYAHQVSSVIEWKDWDSGKAGIPPKTPGQGPKGIEHCNADAKQFIKAWSML